jgi:peptidylamidoglycolate lyase
MKNELVGHNGYVYKVISDWGQLDPEKVPVKDCHEMVMSRSGLLYMLGNHTDNNVIVYNKDGSLNSTWGTTYPGAHGLSIHDENGTEYLYITDTERNEVIKTTLDGRELMVLGYPAEIEDYGSAADYKPTETAIASNGDIYVTDGYGLQFVIQYNAKGEYIRHWGGRGEGPAHFDCVHGIAIDKRSLAGPSLLVTSRNQNVLKRFTMEGAYLGDIPLPGSFICRPVIHGKNVYGAVFRSETNTNPGSGYLLILDENNRVVSSPGATEPVYTGDALAPQRQATKTFIHPHDVCVDENGDLYIPQWNSGGLYPVKLERTL